MDAQHHSASSTFTTPISEANPQHPQHYDESTCLHPPADERSGPSNEYVLNVAFVSFIAFLIMEAIFAVIAKSQSMLADAEAMSVDAMTYLFNFIAERIKHTPYSAAELQLSIPVRHYRRELLRLYLEFLPPMISVITLMMVTVIALQDALTTLRQDYPNDKSDNVVEDDNVSLPIMLIFSSGNLILDIMNVTCFARAHNAFGLQVVERETPSSMLPPDDDDENDNDDEHDDDDDDDEHDNNHHNMNHHTTNHHHHHHHHHHNQHNENDANRRLAADEETSLLPSRLTSFTSTSTTSTTTNPHLTTLDSFRSREPTERSVINLNMCSAWTHVCADTLRSLAVLVAASIATFVPGVESGVADAAAAVAVSVIILASLIPLMHALYELSCEIYEHWTRKP